MIESIPFTPDILDRYCIVDVRSPGEYAEDHLPGAINVPLLDDEQRAQVGTTYKQIGPQEARVLGLQLTAADFPRMIAEIAAHAAGRPILVYCWRGGLRSQTMTMLLELTGYPAVRLAGGYKTFRTVVSAYFEPFVPSGTLVVLHGLTGSGKTRFLERLPSDLYEIVDLEGIACHRGSAFGELGLCQDLTQKQFESRLWDRFRKIEHGKVIVLEGESRRIGRVSLPGNLYDVMGEGIRIWCETPLEIRVQRLIEDYGKKEYAQGMRDALQRIRKRLGADKEQELLGYLEGWEMEPFMTVLMRDYYDRVYYKTREWQEDCCISLADYDAAAGELQQFLKNRNVL